MEKVICRKCGSVGYTASPEQVPCSECGGRHKVIGKERRPHHAQSWLGQVLTGRR